MPGRTTLRLLFAEDEDWFARSAVRALSPHVLERVATVAALRARAVEAFDGLVLDVRLLDGSSPDVVDELRARGDERPVVYLTGPADDDRDTVNRAAGQGAQVVFKIEGWHRHLLGAVERWHGDPSIATVRRLAQRAGCTESEVDVVVLRARGLSIEEIAARRGSSVPTVKTLGKRAAGRVGITSVTGLLRKWLDRA